MQLTIAYTVRITRWWTAYARRGSTRGVQSGHSLAGAEKDKRDRQASIKGLLTPLGELLSCLKGSFPIPDDNHEFVERIVRARFHEHSHDEVFCNISFASTKVALP